MTKNLQYLAYATIFPIFIVWNYLYFTGGCKSPICKVLGVYNYEIANLNDYISYIAGDDLYRIHNASSLSFSCEKLRDQLMDMLYQSMLDDMALIQIDTQNKDIENPYVFGVKRNGNILHITNNAVGMDKLNLWAEEIRAVIEAKPEDTKINWLPETLRRLFDSVVLHAESKEIKILIPYDDNKRKC